MTNIPQEGNTNMTNTTTEHVICDDCGEGEVQLYTLGNGDLIDVICDDCGEGEVQLYTLGNGDLIEHPTRPGFYRVYCDHCGKQGGIDSTKDAGAFAMMRTGKVYQAPHFVAAATRKARK